MPVHNKVGMKSIAAGRLKEIPFWSVSRRIRFGASCKRVQAVRKSNYNQKVADSTVCIRVERTFYAYLIQRRASLNEGLSNFKEPLGGKTNRPVMRDFDLQTRFTKTPRRYLLRRNSQGC